VVDLLNDGLFLDRCLLLLALSLFRLGIEFIQVRELLVRFDHSSSRDEFLDGCRVRPLGLLNLEGSRVDGSSLSRRLLLRLGLEWLLHLTKLVVVHSHVLLHLTVLLVLLLIPILHLVCGHLTLHLLICHLLVLVHVAHLLLVVHLLSVLTVALVLLLVITII
jgi:hypothetical protein